MAFFIVRGELFYFEIESRWRLDEEGQWCTEAFLLLLFVFGRETNGTTRRYEDEEETVVREGKTDLISSKNASRDLFNQFIAWDSRSFWLVITGTRCQTLTRSWLRRYQ
jgi:hypothetical protein